MAVILSPRGNEALLLSRRMPRRRSLLRELYSAYMQRKIFSMLMAD